MFLFLLNPKAFFVSQKDISCLYIIMTRLRGRIYWKGMLQPKLFCAKNDKRYSIRYYCKQYNFDFCIVPFFEIYRLYFYKLIIYLFICLCIIKIYSIVITNNIMFFDWTFKYTKFKPVSSHIASIALIN